MNKQGTPKRRRDKPLVSVKERFERFVDRSGAGGCWLWTGYVDPSGYGKLRVNDAIEYAHRVSYEAATGTVLPRGNRVSLDHLCRNRRCVNPLHLELVSARENILRGEGVAAHNARKSHCKRGHVLAEQVGEHRKCLVCVHDRNKARPSKSANQVAVQS